MTSDPYTTSAKDMCLPALINLSAEHEPNLFFDGDRFMHHLNINYNLFDVMTYSMSKAKEFPLGRINRLIYGLTQRGVNCIPRAKKFVSNNHIKMFLCYSSPTLPPDIYIGSQNLTHGTNLNIMIKVQPCHVQPLVAFFELVWSS